MDPETATRTLREPAQSKCTWSCHKSQNLQGKCHAPDGSRDRDPHFARACAVEMHMDMSQEPFYARICARACAVEMHMDMSRAILRENAQGKRREHLEKNATPQMDPETATHCLGEKMAWFSKGGVLKRFRTQSCHASHRQTWTPGKPPEFTLCTTSF